MLLSKIVKDGSANDENTMGTQTHWPQSIHPSFIHQPHTEEPCKPTSGNLGWHKFNLLLTKRQLQSKTSFELLRYIIDGLLKTARPYLTRLLSWEKKLLFWENNPISNVWTESSTIMSNDKLTRESTTCTSTQLVAFWFHVLGGSSGQVWTSFVKTLPPNMRHMYSLL